MGTFKLYCSLVVTAHKSIVFIEQVSTQNMESKVSSITRLYYSKPAVQQALLEFGAHREVVPRYGEGFGKRPDSLTYPSDIMNLVLKGATSFHASEEQWKDAMQLSTELSQTQLSELRSGWDLLIDIDSPYLDYSKIAAELIIEVFEKYGIESYGLKFSGNKGFHLILPWEAFPFSYRGESTSANFPEWPRAVVSFLFHTIRPSYNRKVAALGINFERIKERTNRSKEELVETNCPNCGAKVIKGIVVTFECDRCHTPVIRPNFKPTNRVLKCPDVVCPGHLELKEQKEFFKCESCGVSSLDKRDQSSSRVIYEHKATLERSFSDNFKEEFSAEKLGALDLVLVSPRHLFRMPYSLHEKSGLASCVLTKEELELFSPKDADPLKLVVRPFYKKAKPGEALSLLIDSLTWSEKARAAEKATIRSTGQFEELNPDQITEDMFPLPIKKLLLGIRDGRKRGLFIIITFLRSLNFSRTYVEDLVANWNTKNAVPLKEGYIKSQIEWHFRQQRKILPPNYANESFYKDLGLLETPPSAKNPVAEVARRLKQREK